MKATFKMTLELEVKIDNGKNIFETTAHGLGLLRSDVLTSILTHLKKYTTAEALNTEFITFNNPIKNIDACASKTEIII